MEIKVQTNCDKINVLDLIKDFSVSNETETFTSYLKEVYKVNTFIHIFLGFMSKK